MLIKQLLIHCSLLAIWFCQPACGEDFKITEISRQGENVVVKFPANQGFAYILQSSKDLEEWQDLQTVRWDSTSSEATLSQTYDSPTGKGFFRVSKFNSEGLKTYFNEQRIAGKAYAPGPSLVAIPSEHSLEAGVADSDGRSITNILPYCSINDSGQIAFLGETVGEDGQVRRNIYQYSAGSTAAPVAGMNVSSTFELPYNPDVMAAVTQDFGPPILDNSGNMYAWRRMTALVQYGFPIGPILAAPLTYLEGWSVTSPAYGRMPVSQLAMGNAGSGPAESGLFWLNPVSTGTLPSPYLGSSPWFAVHGIRDEAYPDVNNLGQAAFIALGSGNNLVTTALTSFSQGVPVGETLPRPKIADNGSVVACVGAGNNRTLMLYSYDLSSSAALTGSNFSEVWPNCDISDDGRIVVFYGVLNESSETLSLTPGPGAFAFVGAEPITPENASKATLVRMAGIAGNGNVDPGETFSDKNGNGLVEVGEDVGTITSFSSEQRISVNNKGVVVFGADDLILATFISRSDNKHSISSQFVQLALGSEEHVSDSINGMNGYAIYSNQSNLKLLNGVIVPFNLEGYSRGTINQPGNIVSRRVGEYGQETVLMENADSEDNETHPDYTTSTIDPTNDDDMVKVVLYWPSKLQIRKAKLELKHTGMEVDPTKTADAEKYKETGPSRLNFYKPDGTKLTDADLKIDDLENPGSGYLAEILNTGELTLFIEGAENFGNLGLTSNKMKLLGGAMLNFEITQSGITNRVRLLVYRGGFLVFRQPKGKPGQDGIFEFWDGKGRIKNQNGGYQNEFQEDETDWGQLLKSWAAKSGKTNGSADYRTGGGKGYTPPGWWWAEENPLHVSEQQLNPASGKITNRNKPNEKWNQAAFNRWLQDDAQSRHRYTADYVYDKSIAHDAQIGQPTFIEFKFRLFAIPPSTPYSRTGLLIHPDGKKDGTLGCIGLQTWEGCNGAANILRRYHGLKLKVQHN